MNALVRLAPSLRPKIWGRTRLQPWFPDSPEPIGEAWYLTDRELPLLVKLIFTSERLSVQLHPDDGEDGPRGKNEMWHILEAEPGAALALGFREPLTRERLREVSTTGEIEGLLNWIPVRPGETYFTPAHTVHAIGDGLVLCEIQQNSDTTYRLWDYGRPRPLHLEQAIPIADLRVHPGAARPIPIAGHREELVRTRHFVTELVRLAAGQCERPAVHECQIWIAVSGHGTIAWQGTSQPYRQGEVWLLPDTGEQPEFHAQSSSRFLRTWVPD